MVSRRNYFSITIIMFVIFFLFQTSSATLENWNRKNITNRMIVIEK